MRLWPPCLALLGLGLSPPTRADGPADSLNSLPDCAVNCLIPSVRDSSCEPSDQHCICADAALQAEVTTCVQSSCTIRESLTTKNATQASCGVPIRDKSPHLRALIIAIGIIAGVTVIFRLAFKQWARLGWSLDDWFILATGLTKASTTAISIYGTIPNGLGRDAWTLSFDAIMKFGYYFFIMVVIYFVEVALLKTSILFFYLRIFPGLLTRRVLCATLVLNGMFGVAFFVAVLFQCSPISYNWTKWDGDHTGSCLNITAIAWSNAIVSIVFDIWMLAIPLCQLHKLRLHWKRKVGVGLMFVVGTFVTIISILRLQSLVSFARSAGNSTWGYADVTKWSIIEIGVGTVCASMPTLRLALVRYSGAFRERTLRTAGYSYQRKSYRNTTQQRHESIPARGNTCHAMATADKDLGPVAPDRVVCRTSFAVEYAQEDNIHLVPMRDVLASEESSGGSRRSSRSLRG